MSDIKPVSDVQHTAFHLMSELEKGRKSGEEKGWLSLEVVEQNLKIAINQAIQSE